jgi:hypothetical protein
MPILTETFEGTPGGMNLALPQQELDDTEARYIQDGLVDYPRPDAPARSRPQGHGHRRPDAEGSGLALTLNPQGSASRRAQR